MRLLYDNLIYYLQVNGGISTYWYELTIRFLKEEQISFNFYEPNQKTANVLRNKLAISEKQIINQSLFIPLIERFIKLPIYNKAHIFHSSYFRTPVKASNTIVVTTVHDFTHEKYYRGPRLWTHKYLKDIAINASDCIIAVSQYTKNELLNRYPHIKESNVKVISHGASSDFKYIKNVNCHTENPFFLFVGSREQYKNFDFAIELTAACKDFHLYIVGSPLTGKQHQLLNKKLKNRFLAFENIDNSTLNTLYNTAFCLLYPSSNEGFGIPVLEAMQAGCPFIALHASSIPEVAGEAGILLQSLNLDEALCAVETIANRKIEIVEKGLKQATKFSWDNCFKETYSLYRSLAS